MSRDLPWILPWTQVPVVTLPSTVPFLFTPVLNTSNLTPSTSNLSTQNGTTNSFVPLSISTTLQANTWSRSTSSFSSNLVPISTITTNTEPVYVLNSDDVPTIPYSTSSNSTLDLSMSRASSGSLYNQGSIPALNSDVLQNSSLNTQSSIFANAYLWSFSITNTRCDCAIHVNR